MQGTVRSWDPQSRAGILLLDDGHELPFQGKAVQVRRLHPGQRVRVRLDELGQAVALTIGALPFT